MIGSKRPINPPMKRSRGGRDYQTITTLYVVRFCRLYGQRDMEPFEIRAVDQAQAIHLALQRRWNDDDK